MNRTITVLVLSLLAQPQVVAAEDSDIGDWLVAGAPDPTVITAHDGSGHYVFATGKGIAIFQSTDLTQWKRIGRVFQQAVPTWAKKRIPGSKSVWAPEIQRLNGKYHLYYSVSTFGSQRSVIGLAVNDTLNPQSPNYKWEDRGLVIESFPDRTDFNAIDPAMFVDDGGRAFLFWGSYWTGIKATELDITTGKPKTAPLSYVSVARRADVAPLSIEAPYVIKRNGFYYLFVSWDFCCAREKSTYKVMVGRSRSPLGPFIDDEIAR